MFYFIFLALVVFVVGKDDGRSRTVLDASRKSKEKRVLVLCTVRATPNSVTSLLERVACGCLLILSP